MPFGPAPTSSLRLSSIAGRGRLAGGRIGWIFAALKIFVRRFGFVFCSGCFKGTNSLSRFRKPVFKGVWFEQRIPEPAVSPADRNAGGQSENRVPQGFRAAVFPIPSKMCAVGRHYGLILKYIHKTLFLRIQPGFSGFNLVS